MCDSTYNTPHSSAANEGDNTVSLDPGGNAPVSKTLPCTCELGFYPSNFWPFIKHCLPIQLGP